MKHKIPKELEKVPIVLGLELKKVIFITIAALLFVFLMVTNLLLALVFPILVVIYIYIANKFKKEGEFLNYIKYNLNPKVIIFDKTIEELLNK
ncbi:MULTISPECIES: hypothetical protein [Zobellia]|uniref:PrgI family protein n=2 Tax=Zobellia TaxID=112040 RepID=A0ABY1L2B0_9FLAO|nr:MULTISPECIES: hypothetical protein [Zobellia]MBU3027544.1 hypothetical protein [Zobellia galactanivorans]CAZ97235.1 Hypothetical membrane protein [Zobellia galactanivorans]SIT16522.1 hypothetical protein SAMN05421766_1191 [Zobellia uliginosa]